MGPVTYWVLNAKDLPGFETENDPEFGDVFAAFEQVTWNEPVIGLNQLPIDRLVLDDDPDEWDEFDRASMTLHRYVSSKGWDGVMPVMVKWYG